MVPNAPPSTPGAPKVDFLTPEALKTIEYQKNKNESSQIGLGLHVGVKGALFLCRDGELMDLVELGNQKNSLVLIYFFCALKIFTEIAFNTKNSLSRSIHFTSSIEI